MSDRVQRLFCLLVIALTAIFLIATHCGCSVLPPSAFHPPPLESLPPSDFQLNLTLFHRAW